ncbi:Bug family tripartite tricarboxylate transporter substrate binding protein [Phreatobacter stygius]|uniref:Tripartite tricarboxylate transporter substrate binding protein n=1 Tax=Phreatobacter stygius TaxID=1940610 RepID=A0A4D7B8W9_9HYPH|nr:tripartite tricarboxylate transporter substrate binding protein [Phreatobacter stygius]QCI67365.1 tripartite tricarboxylate transporter substrate binding protein [Phreatobacter stygius]
MRTARYWQATGITMLGLMLLSLAASLPARAAFPDRALRIVVGFAPGGSTDIIARLVADGLSTRLGQPVVVENRGGAGGVLAAQLVAQQPADGYTLMLHTDGLNQAAAVGTAMVFDPVDAFAPVGLAAKSSLVLVVHPSIPAQNLNEFLAYARKSPHPLRFGSPGSGLSGQLFAQGLGIPIEEVRYRGTSAVLNDLLAARIDAYTIAFPGILSYVQAGALRALAIASAERSRVMPDLPTGPEQGFPEVIATGWFGIVVKAGTPPEVIAKLHRALNETLDDAVVRRRIGEIGLDIAPSAKPEDFGQLIRDDRVVWERVATRGNLRQ